MSSLDTSTDLTRTAKGTPAKTQETYLRVMPPVDVYENQDELLLVADVPGAKQDSVEVRLEPPRLTIEATQFRAAFDASNAPLIRFERSFRVPDGLDPDKVEAKLERGVLTIHLKKSERIKPKRIAVRGE